MKHAKKELFSSIMRKKKTGTAGAATEMNKTKSC
jgi:hypothetical protein